MALLRSASLSGAWSGASARGRWTRAFAITAVTATAGGAACDAGSGAVASAADAAADVAADAVTDVTGSDADALGCEAEAVDATVGACRFPLTGPTFDCAGTWAEQRLRGCKPGVVVFVSADNAPAGQLVWFERPWFSGGTSCFYVPETQMLVGSWYVRDSLHHCCRTSFDVTYGSFDDAANEAAVRAAQPWVGKLYEQSGIEIVDGGEVRYCASGAP